MKTLTKQEQIMSWVCRIIAAVILFQTLFFKFTGATESVYIFTQVHMEPWGRYASGIAELIAAILLLLPCYALAGALLAIGVMLGAIGSHLTVLGISVQGDGGLLFGLALAVLTASIVTAILHRRQIPIVSDFCNPRHA